MLRSIADGLDLLLIVVGGILLGQGVGLIGMAEMIALVAGTDRTGPTSSTLRWTASRMLKGGDRTAAIGLSSC